MDLEQLCPPKIPWSVKLHIIATTVMYCLSTSTGLLRWIGGKEIFDELVEAGLMTFVGLGFAISLLIAAFTRR